MKNLIETGTILCFVSKCPSRIVGPATLAGLIKLSLQNTRDDSEREVRA